MQYRFIVVNSYELFEKSIRKKKTRENVIFFIKICDVFLWFIFILSLYKTITFINKKIVN